MKSKILLAVFIASCSMLHSAFAFEGRITAAFTRGGQAAPLLYTAGTNFLRVEITAADRPNPVNLLDLTSGEMTLLFPNNRSFVRLKPASETASTAPPGSPAMPQMPPGVGPQASPGANAMPAMPTMPQMPAMPTMPAGGGMPAMPMMPPPMTERIDLTSTGEQTNLLGFVCVKYEIKQGDEVMEIWATDKLFPFQPYQQNQPRRFSPRTIEEQWGELVKARKLFPLLAVLKFEPFRQPVMMPGTNSPAQTVPPRPPDMPERLRFEVKSVTPEKIPDGTLFQPPPGYQAIQPLPF